MVPDEEDASARTRLVRWYSVSLRPRLVRAADEGQVNASHVRELDWRLRERFGGMPPAVQPVRAERTERRR